MTTVASIAHRTLGDLARYRSCQQDPAHCERLAVGIAGEIIGVYENPTGEAPTVVVVSATSLVWKMPTGLQRVDFTSIRDVRGPEKTPTASEIQIRVDGGTSVSLSILGGDEKHRDVYSFVRFLLRVTEIHEHGRRPT